MVSIAGMTNLNSKWSVLPEWHNTKGRKHVRVSFKALRKEVRKIPESFKKFKIWRWSTSQESLVNTIRMGGSSWIGLLKEMLDIFLKLNMILNFKNNLASASSLAHLQFTQSHHTNANLAKEPALYRHFLDTIIALKNIQ